MNADLDSSSSEEEEDSDEESKKRSQFIDYEAEEVDHKAVEDGNNEDDFSPDYEAGEEGGNENSGGQETADPYMNLLLGEAENDLDNYFDHDSDDLEWEGEGGMEG